MKKTDDALQIIDNFIGDDEQIRDLITDSSLKMQIGQLIYDARIKAGLSQEELGKLIGISGEIIDDLELADYDGNALFMLQKIADVLEQKIKLELLSVGA